MVSGSDKKRIEKISFLTQQDEITRSLVIHASESVRRKMRGGAAAEAVIKANREKLLEKAKETGLL